MIPMLYELGYLRVSIMISEYLNVPDRVSVE